MRKTAWGRTSRACVYCSRPGPRCQVLGGYAHKRCIPKNHPDHPDRIRKEQRSKKS